MLMSASCAGAPAKLGSTFVADSSRERMILSCGARPLDVQAKSQRIGVCSNGASISPRDAIETRQTILQLEEQKKSELEILVRTGVTTRQAEDPVFQEVSIALGQAEADVAAKRVRVQEFRRRVNELKEKVDTVPKVEAELAKLNRDYNVVKDHYETLLARRESAKLSDVAEQSEDDVKFKVIEPPYLPLSPSGPRRQLFATAVLLGGIGAGILLAFALAKSMPVFHTGQNLAAMMNRRLLGTVSFSLTAAVRRQKRMALALFSLGSFSLLAAYVAVTLLPYFNVSSLAGLGSALVGFGSSFFEWGS